MSHPSYPHIPAAMLGSSNNNENLIPHAAMMLPSQKQITIPDMDNAQNNMIMQSNIYPGGIAQPAQSPQQQQQQSTPRRVLGDVSPNVRKVGLFSNGKGHNSSKPVTGSPLKRSFTAALEGPQQGFTYLKRRKGVFEDSMGADGSIDGMGQHAMPSYNAATSMAHVQMSLGMGLDDQTRLPADMGIPTAQMSPTEVNTPSCEDEDERAQHRQQQNEAGSGQHGAHQLQQSFSSLINYDVNSSQPRNGASLAQILKLRLQVAMYKIRTGQIDVPFDDLRVMDLDEEEDEDEDEDEAEEEEEADDTIDPQLKNPESVEDQIARRRQEAQAATILALSEQGAQQPSSTTLDLLPHPSLLPTTYSSRMIYSTSTDQHHHDDQLPSSPPALPHSPTRINHTNAMGLPPHLALGDNLIREFTTTPARNTARRFDDLETEMTSSAVKGHVAEGLLGLRHAA